MARKTLAHLALGAMLFTGGLAAANAALPAQAAPAARHAQMCIYPCRPPQPTVSLYGHYGTVYISGTHWTPNLDVEITIYMPVSAGGAVTQTWAYVNKYGSFSTTWLAPSGCFYGQVEVQVHDETLNKTLTGYVVPGCIG